MKLTPISDRIIVKAKERETKTKGGIIIPDTVQDKPKQGKVLAAGPGGYDKDGNKVTMQIKVGDEVLFGMYSSSEIEINDEKLLIMRQSDVYAVIG